MKTDWMADALCAQTDPDAFFPEQGASVTLQKAVCARCDVAAVCLAYALEHDERNGGWGGLSRGERQQLERTEEGRAGNARRSRGSLAP